MNIDVEKFLRELMKYDAHDTTERIARDTAAWASNQARELLEKAGMLKP